MLAVDWMVVLLIALLALSFAGLAAFFVGRKIEQDAKATPDNAINRARQRSAGRFIVVGAFMTLSCALAAIVVVLLIALPVNW